MSDGRWEENDAQWYELRMLYCDLCGRIIPKHLWKVEIGGETKTFCDQSCEALYRDYVLGEASRV